MKTTIITIQSRYAHIARGHQSHRSGAGIHRDRRTKRQRTRRAQLRAALRD